VDGSRVSFSFVLNLPPLIDMRLLNSRQTQIDAQMKLLNERYVGTGVSFNYVSVTRILSRYWHETIDAGLYVVLPPLSNFVLIQTSQATNDGYAHTLQERRIDCTERLLCRVRFCALYSHRFSSLSLVM